MVGQNYKKILLVSLVFTLISVQSTNANYPDEENEIIEGEWAGLGPLELDDMNAKKGGRLDKKTCKCAGDREMKKLEALLKKMQVKVGQLEAANRKNEAKSARFQVTFLAKINYLEERVLVNHAKPWFNNSSIFG